MDTHATSSAQARGSPPAPGPPRPCPPPAWQSTAWPSWWSQSCLVGRGADGKQIMLCVARTGFTAPRSTISGD